MSQRKTSAESVRARPAIGFYPQATVMNKSYCVFDETSQEERQDDVIKSASGKNTRYAPVSDHD